MRRIFFYTTLLFVLMVQYPLVSFAEKRNLIFTANKVNPAQDPRDKFQRTIMMMPSVAIDEYELFFSDSHPSYINRVQEIFAQKKTVFQGLEFSTNYSTTYNPDVRKPLCIRLDGFDENKMAFYADPKSNMRYIYDSSKKIAFAYNEDEEYGDYVLDYYGIRDWVESLPKRSTSMMILQNYTIIGL